MCCILPGNGGITTQQDATASTISAAAITNTDYTNQLEERVNQLVNEFRAQNGLGPLTRDARIDLQVTAGTWIYRA